MLRRVYEDHNPVPVSEEEMDDGPEEFQWFINLGRTVDWKRIPDTMPAVVSFISDDESNLWVKREAARPEDEGRLFDLFNPKPIVREGMLCGVTTDDPDAPNVVRPRMEKP